MENIDLQAGLLGTILGIIGIAAALYFARERRPLFIAGANAHQVVLHHDLEIKFRGEIVPNLYSVRFVIWNAGSKERRVKESPSPEAGPQLKFSNDTQLLFYIANTMNGEKSGQLIADEPDESHLQFDYLSKGDSILGEALCATKNKSQPEVSLSGNFTGPVIKLNEPFLLSRGEYIFFTFTTIVLILYSGWLAYSIYMAFAASHMLWGTIFTLSFLTTLLLTYLESRFILSIPYQLPRKYKHYLDHGSLP
jgi:hypothetical protein